jgi:hypothetical protein
VPVLVRKVEQRRVRPVPRAVDERVDAAPALHRRVDEALQVVVRLVRPRDADAADLPGERLAFSRGGEDRNLKPVCRELACGAGADPAAARRHDGDFVCHCRFPISYRSALHT